MIALRAVMPGDLDTVCAHRRAMFAESGRTAGILDAMDRPHRDWLAPRLADGRYFGFLAEAQGAVVAGVGMMIHDWPPHPNHPHDARRGYVLDVYVAPTHRGRGVARALMREAQAEFAWRGVGYAILHPTHAGLALYAQEGWEATGELGRGLP